MENIREEAINLFKNTLRDVLKNGNVNTIEPTSIEKIDFLFEPGELCNIFKSVGNTKKIISSGLLVCSKFVDMPLIYKHDDGIIYFADNSRNQSIYMDPNDQKFYDANYEIEVDINSNKYLQRCINERTDEAEVRVLL